MAKKPEYNYKSLQTEYGKMPPQAVDLEEAILGSLMLEKPSRNRGLASICRS